MAAQIAVGAYAAEAAGDKFAGHRGALSGAVLEGHPAPSKQMERGAADNGEQVRQRVLTRGQRLPGLMPQGLKGPGSRAST